MPDALVHDVPVLLIDRKGAEVARIAPQRGLRLVWRWRIGRVSFSSARHDVNRHLSGGGIDDEPSSFVPIRRCRLRALTLVRDQLPEADEPALAGRQRRQAWKTFPPQGML